MKKIDKGTIILGATAVVCVGALGIYFRHEIKDFVKKHTLGTYFTIDELSYSAKAESLGIDNTPTLSARSNLKRLVKNCLNPIRERYGKPIRVSSGYRSKKVNEAVGGVSNSQHTTGNAVDLVPFSGGSLNDIFKSAVELGNFDQVIYEEDGKGSKWVHVSYNGKDNRGQILAYNGSKYTDITRNWKSYVV